MATQTLSYCAEQIRRFDHDRFLCGLFAPEAEREALFALYTFNLDVARIPELARDPLLRRIRLQWWIDTLDVIYGGGPTPSGHPGLPALAATIHRYRLSRILFDQLLEARAHDFDAAAPETMAALIDYADATSATLSNLGLQILGVDDADVQAAARDVAIAWSLSGLIRAVPFHARSRRVYLPVESNRAAGLDVLKLFESGSSPQLSPQLRKAVEPIADTARSFLASARRRCPMAPTRAMPVLLPASLADGYLKQIERAGYDPFHPALRKPAAWWPLRLAIRQWRRRY